LKNLPGETTTLRGLRGKGKRGPAQGCKRGETANDQIDAERAGDKKDMASLLIAANFVRE